MRRRRHLTTLLASAAFLTADASAQTDTVPPAMVTDFRVSGNDATSITLTWTAPGDDGNSGRASSYDVRFAAKPVVTNTDFAAAAQAIGAPAPGAAGATEEFTLVGLNRASIYYFSVKAVDESGNTGGISNEASGNTRFEGYGYAVTGGSGRDVFHVTSLEDAGPGTLREAISGNRSGPRSVVFDVGGEITLLSDIVIRASTGTDRITIDGSTAPYPGITIRKQSCPPGLTSCPAGHACLTDGEFKIGGNDPTPTEEVILSHLRFHGNYQASWGSCSENSGATLGVQYHFRGIVLDHLTMRNGVDSSPDLWTGSHHSFNITYSYNVIAFSNHPLTISDSGGGGSRSNLSLHHNVLARSRDRLPQVRFETTDLDFRNNVVFDWVSYGMRIRNDEGQTGSRKVNANIVGNYFIPGNGNPRHAFYYGEGPGTQSSTIDGDGGPPSCTTADGCANCPVQGAVVTTSYMGALRVEGNDFPAQVCEKYSTVSSERPVPVEAQVTTFSAPQLVNSVLPFVGTHYRLPDEQSLLDEIAVAMGGSLQAPANLRIVLP